MPGLSAGRLRHRLVLQRPIQTQDANTGSIQNTWETVATVWGAIEPVNVRAFIAAQSEVNKVTSKIIIRYRDDVSPRWRVLHEAKGLFYIIEGVLSDKDSGLEYLTLPVSEGVKFTDETPPS